MAKIVNKKTKCNKAHVEQLAPVPVANIDMDVPARVVASVVGCSPMYVKRIRQGKQEVTTVTAEKVHVADMLLKCGVQELITNTKALIEKSY
ncbi:MAG: hypothetical protein ACK4EY_14585 [Flavipsychrobacter sp.]